MTVHQKFDLPVGGTVTLFNNDLVFNGETDAGYEFTDMASGQVSIVSYQTFVDYLKLPGVKLNFDGPETGDRLQFRMGGVQTSENLTEAQKAFARFNLSLCQAMQLLRNKLNLEYPDDTVNLSISMMNRRDNREFVRAIAEEMFGQKILLDTPRGGKGSNWTMYKGRTLVKYLKIFDELQPNESPLDALVSLDHLKGNRNPRITNSVKMMMTQAWEEVGLDTKSPSVANVHDRLEVLIHEENKHRMRNGLSRLEVPGEDTLSRHRHYLLTPTEYLPATKGERHARGKRGRGSTDIRALLVGELVEIDECKASLVASARAEGIWERLAKDSKDALEDIDKIIKQRLSILVMIDVASRMPLAWVISDQPKAEATLALFRMATRDKQREKQLYGCDGDPVGVIGIGNVKNDNGPGLRNTACVTALMGVGATNTIARAYASTDKPYVERMFGTIEAVLLKLVHGYTGGKPGQLPGYDATVNGVLNIDELYGILTRFLIDVYPSTRHMGVGMGGRRPYEVYREIAETRGCIRPIDPNMRRIHLGWEEKVMPTDEGVRVFGGIWFNSDDLQIAVDGLRAHQRKVSVYVDPDDMSRATVLVPGVSDPVEVHLQMTAFADMTLVDILNLMGQWLKENPKVTEAHDDRIMKFRQDFYKMQQAIGLERNLPRSFSTIAECKTMAKAIFAGARVVPGRGLKGTIAPDDIMNIGVAENVFQIGDDDGLIEGEVVFTQPQDMAPVPPAAHLSSATAHRFDGLSSPPTPPKESSSRRKKKAENPSQTLGRPENLKDLE